MAVVLLIVLLVAHLALGYRYGHAEAVPPQLAMLLVQAMAVWAVLTRYRRSPALIRLPWLLLALAVLMQMSWDSTNVLATVVGDKSGYLAALATVLSGLYVIPCMFMSTRSFTQHEPRAVAVLDLVLFCLVAALVYQCFTTLLSGPLASDPASIHVVVDLADAIDFSLAAMAIVRLLGARSFRWRHFYYTAGAYLLVNATVACVYNRIEMHGLPWWAGSLIDIPHALLVVVALRQPPRWLRSYHPSLAVSQTIASFAPILLSTMLVMLCISTSRFNYVSSLVVGALAVMFYGLRVAFIQSRQIDHQRAIDQSAWRLEQQLGRDPLTGIANRVTLDKRLREAMHEGRRTGRYCSLLMIDIDYFKQYNDSLGHIAGDACLVRVAGALARSRVRVHDLVARYGGEEFAIVLVDTSAEVAQEVARRLITAIEHLQIAHPACPLGRLSISIGLATQTGQTPIDPVAMLAEADHALYRAKRNGRNRFEAATGDGDPSASLVGAGST